MSDFKVGDRVVVKAGDGWYTAGANGKVIRIDGGGYLWIEPDDPECHHLKYKKFCYYKDWIELEQPQPSIDQPIMVPVDPSCVPAGYRAVRCGIPKDGELTVFATRYKPSSRLCDAESIIQLIVEKIPEPIVLPDWIPAGWWIGRDEGGQVGIGSMKPEACATFNEWSFPDESVLLHLYDSTGIPQAYLDLPWQESLMQKGAKE